MRRVMADTPSLKYDRSLGPMRDLQKNQADLHDWRMKILSGLPVGKMCFLPPLPNTYNLYIMDPKMVKHVLKDNCENYTVIFADESLPLSYYIKQFLGMGIFTTAHGKMASDKGDFWKFQRKIASSIFSRQNFNTNMHEVFVHTAENL